MLFFQIGAGLVYITINTVLGTVIFIQTVTPQEAFLQKYTVVLYSDWWIPTFLVKMFAKIHDVQVL